MPEQSIPVWFQTGKLQTGQTTWIAHGYAEPDFRWGIGQHHEPGSVYWYTGIVLDVWLAYDGALDIDATQVQINAPISIISLDPNWKPVFDPEKRGYRYQIKFDILTSPEGPPYHDPENPGAPIHRYNKFSYMVFLQTPPA